MKITFIAFGFTEYSIELANKLALNHRVLLILDANERMRVLGKIEKGFLSKNLRIESIQHKTFRNPKVLLDIYRLIKWIKDFEPDIIHIQETTRIYLLIAIFLWKKSPIILTVHDPYIHIGESYRKHHKWAMGALRRRSDTIVVHGKYLLEIIKKKFKNKNICVVPHGCFSIFGKKLNDQISEEKKIILFFGRIHKYKGLKYLIKAEPYIKKEIPDIKIIIAGTGKDLENYREKIENNKSYILYDRYIPNEMIAELFQQASIVVLPYIEASQSGVINIAYAFGKPVVATNVGSIPEVVDDGKTGYIVPSKDSIRLAKAVINLLRDEDKRKKMGKNAYRKATTDLSWDNIARKTVKVYQDTLNNHKIPKSKRKLSSFLVD